MFPSSQDATADWLGGGLGFAIVPSPSMLPDYVWVD